MKKLRFFLSFAVIFLLLAGSALAADVSVKLFDASTGLYAAQSVNTVHMTCNGTAVTSSIPPVLITLDGDARTMVPVRAISEKLGATVEWLSDTFQVRITLDEKTILLTIGSADALVNGEHVTLYGDISAMLMRYDNQDYTMVPLRFVSEQLGATVSWDASTYTAEVTTEQPVSLTAIRQEDDQIILSLSGTVETNCFSLTNPSRVVVDLPGAVLACAPGTLKLSGVTASDLRYSQYDTGYDGYSRVVRLVFDGTSTTGDVTMQWDGSSLILTLAEAESTDSPTGTAQTEPSADPTDKTSKDTDTTGAAADGKTVIVLDAGHGGSDPGCQYNNASEKDITLSVTEKLGALLEAQGYTVLYTRTDDTYITLNDRATLANEQDADLFVSIHVNAAASASAAGIETYLHTNGGSNDLALATAVQTSVLASTKAADRGVRRANYAVLRLTDMPAILVETGFLSNEAECANLLDEAYQQKLAEGVAEGIESYLTSVA